MRKLLSVIVAGAVLTLSVGCSSNPSTPAKGGAGAGAGTGGDKAGAGKDARPSPQSAPPITP